MVNGVEYFSIPDPGGTDPFRVARKRVKIALLSLSHSTLFEEKTRYGEKVGTLCLKLPFFQRPDVAKGPTISLFEGRIQFPGSVFLRYTALFFSKKALREYNQEPFLLAL